LIDRNTQNTAYKVVDVSCYSNSSTNYTCRTTCEQKPTRIRHKRSQSQISLDFNNYLQNKNSFAEILKNIKKTGVSAANLTAKVNNTGGQEVPSGTNFTVSGNPLISSHQQIPTPATTTTTTIPTNTTKTSTNNTQYRQPRISCSSGKFDFNCPQGQTVVGIGAGAGGLLLITSLALLVYYLNQRNSLKG